MKPARLIALGLFAAILCGAVAPTTTLTEPRDTTAVVAAWNVRGIPGISATRAEQIAAGIAFIDAEVIVLSEVAPHSRIVDIINELGELDAEYHAVMPNQTAELGLAILHKTGTTVANARLVADSDAGDDDNRKALAADVTIGEFDFLLIGVHLKSGGSSSNRQIRDVQCEAIAEFIEAETAGAEKDVLVIGDYNMVPRPLPGGRNDESNFEKMSPDNFLEFVTKPELCMTGTHIGSNGGLGNFLDGYAVSREHSDEYLDASIRVYPLHRTMRLSLANFRNQVADHLPLVGRFDVVGDDD